MFTKLQVKFEEQILFQYSCLSLILWNIFLLYYSHKAIELQIYNLLLTIGVYYLFEGKMIKIKLNKNNYYKLISFAIVSFLFTRGIFSISEKDPLCYLSLPLILISTILCTEYRDHTNIKLKAIFVSTLMPIRFLIKPLVIKAILTFTSNITWLILGLIGIDANIYMNIIYFKDSKIGLNILSGCSGADQIIFSLTLSLILMILFPVRNEFSKSQFILFSFGIGFIENIFRLTLLSIFTYYSESIDSKFFYFFHDSYGNLFFALISGSLISLYFYKNYIFNSKF